VSSFSLFLHEHGPVAVGLGQIALDVFVEIVADAFAVLEQQFAVHDLERVHVNLDQLVSRDAVRTVAAEGWFVFRRVGLE
jgi:hypothetical protein